MPTIYLRTINTQPMKIPSNKQERSQHKPPVRQVVRRFLETIPATRDSDPYLQARIWSEQRKSMKIPRDQFLHEYAKGRFMLAESIRRERQKLQEQVPELRGKSYVERKTKKEKEWRDRYGKRKDLE